MKEQCHTSNSPALAKELNAKGIEFVRRQQLKGGGDDGDDDEKIDSCSSNTNTNNIILALRLHRKALTIFEWNKRNALLYDHVEQSMEYAVEMACTLCVIGGLLRRMNDFAGAAEVYKECLDNFLVGLITGGRKILECEFNTPTSASTTTAGVSDSVDRHAIGKALCYHPEFRCAVHNISQLVCEMQCIKFVGGQNAASSRRRQRMIQYAAREENLKNAAKSLNMTTSSLHAIENHTKQDNQVCLANRMTNQRFLRSHSLPTATTTTTSQFWEKPAGQARPVSSNRPRPPPVLRRALTSDEEYDQYKALSDMITPVETRLLVALNRFPLPAGIVEDYTSTSLSQCSTSSSTVIEDGALVPSQDQSQNAIEVETSFPFPSMEFVPMNSEKLRVSLPLLC